MSKLSAEQIIAMAKEQLKGQSIDPSKLEKAREKMAEQSGAEHIQEAAAFTEEIVRWLNRQWNEREFTAEQRIFSLALATINFRQHFPDARGGKAKFDEVSKEAWAYFKANSDE